MIEDTHNKKIEATPLTKTINDISLAVSSESDNSNKLSSTQSDSQITNSEQKNISSCKETKVQQEIVKPLQLNKVKDRLLILSPTVQAGLERECTKSDFYREGDKFIGKGGFGEVWKVVHKATNRTYVIKVIDKKSIQEQKLNEQMNREIEIMYKANHPHVMKLINHFEDDDKFYIIMPWASKGQLYSLLRRQVRFDQRTAAQYMRETIEAVRYWHSFTPKIIHRDIKPENWWLDDNYRIKLSDFGWSNFKDEGENRKTYCGTPEYLTPEMIRKTGHDHTVDIWSLGVLLFELLAGYAPFAGVNQAELFWNIKKWKINWPVDFPPWAKNLVSKILKLNPKERISLEEISAHSWFEKHAPLRPVLTNYWTDEKQILESHLINVSPDSVKEEINDIVNPDKRRKYSTLRTRKYSHSNNELKTMVHEMQGDSERWRKENVEWKTKYAGIENEVKNWRNENIHIKDTQTSQHQDQINKLTEELEKYKIMNNERLVLLTELEKKNNESVELKNQWLSYENETINTSRIILSLKKKISDLEKTNADADLEISTLRKKIEDNETEWTDWKNKTQKKIDILQHKILDTDNSSNDDFYGLNNIIQLLSEDVSEFKSIFKKRINMITENIDKFSVEYKKRESAWDDLLMNYVNKNWWNAIDKFKKTISEDIAFAQTKANKEVIKSDMVEWQMKQINELQQYKTKAIGSENKLERLNKTIANLEENLKLTNAWKEELTELNNKKDLTIAGLNEKLNFFKGKLLDIFRFVEQNCKDKSFVQGYKQFYQNEDEI